jgi:AcrR family transcriptional regulator
MANRGQSRETVLVALRGVFEARGFDGATLAQLASAAGLSKASLYHHFPGGKGEMAAVLLRESVAELERLAFARLKGSQSPAERLRRFVDGFQEYVGNGGGTCLVRILAEGGAGAEHAEIIARQYEDWLSRLAATFAAAGMKPRRSKRLATELLADLYGHLALAGLLGRPELFDKHVKRLRKNLPG